MGSLKSVVCTFGALVVCTSACWLTGCGSGEKSFHLSGTITFKGQPVPDGHIIFEPDNTKGNKGAPGQSKIIDGKYDTNSEDGRGVVGGPHLITIMGFDGKSHGATKSEIGLPGILFPKYSTTADLPSEDAVKDFEVPAK